MSTYQKQICGLKLIDNKSHRWMRVKNLRLVLRPLSWWWLWPTLFLWKQKKWQSEQIKPASLEKFRGRVTFEIKNLLTTNDVCSWMLCNYRIMYLKWNEEMKRLVSPLLFGFLFSWPSVADHWHGLKIKQNIFFLLIFMTVPQFHKCENKKTSPHKEILQINHAQSWNNKPTHR